MGKRKIGMLLPRGWWVGVHYNTLICYVYTFAVSIHGVSQVALVAENLPANAGDAKDVGSIPGLVNMWFGVSGMLQEVLEAQQTFPILYPIHHFHLTVPELCWCCSVAPPCPTLCNPMDCSTPGFPVLHYFLEFAQTHFHRVSDNIKPSHPLSFPSPPAFNLSQHQGLF